MSNKHILHSRHRSSFSCCSRPRTLSPTGARHYLHRWEVPFIPREHQASHALSEPFSCDGQNWRLHVNTFQVRQHGVMQSYVAVYLEWLFNESRRLEYQTRFRLYVVNLANEALFYRQRCAHRFVQMEDSGFTLFVPVDDILDKDLPQSTEQGISITLRIMEDDEEDRQKPQSLQFGTYGFSILALFAVAVQYLYHIPYIRSIVEDIPWPDDSTTSDCNIDQQPEEITLLYALQKVFHDISNNFSEHVDLMILFKAYGSQLKDLGKVFDFWEFFQHLTYRLGMYWKEQQSSPFHLLYMGTYVQSFEEINATHLREFEVFQLDTLNSSGFYDALNNACSLENDLPVKQGQSVQSIERSTQFTSLPPVLRFILKRFKYDALQKRDLKLLHFFDFPTHLSIDHSSFKFLSDASYGKAKEQHSRYIYALSCVIAHEGNSLNTGYYVAYVRLDDDRWWKLSESTSIMSEAQVMESCARSACFLSYTRVTDWEWVMSDSRR